MLPTRLSKLFINFINIYVIEVVKPSYELYCSITNKAESYPQSKKIKTLQKFMLQDAIWIETGTYRGTTTNQLSKVCKKIYTIEASENLYLQASYRFRNNPRISVLFGPSPQILKIILKDLGGKVNFWLDAHFSHGQTYQGEFDSPLMEELTEILKHVSGFVDFRIFVDDAHYITTDSANYSGYPTHAEFKYFCSNNNLSIKILNDIFIIENLV